MYKARKFEIQWMQSKLHRRQTTGEGSKKEKKIMKAKGKNYGGYAL